MPNKVKEIDKDVNFDDTHSYKCLCCGKEEQNPVGKFYKSQWSELYIKNDKFVPYCIDCIKKKFENDENKFQTEMATILMCHRLDIPFYHSLYRSIIEKNQKFSIGLYLRNINGRQYQFKTFDQSILEGELSKDNKDIRDVQESKWTKEEVKNKDTVISLVGYDPFEAHNEKDRKYLFNELVNYFDDDIEDDRYKLSQIVQIVINNSQIRNCDSIISSLNPIRDSKEIKELNSIKATLVGANDKIAKENEISVKNRSNKQAGKSTLTHYMKELREMDFDRAEANYYDQLTSEGTRWANDISMQSILKHTFLDENDKKEIYETNLKLLEDTYKELDVSKEKIRLLIIENDKLKSLVPSDSLGCDINA